MNLSNKHLKQNCKSTFTKRYEYTHKPGTAGISPPLIKPTSLTGRSPAVSSTTGDITLLHSDSADYKTPGLTCDKRQTNHVHIHCWSTGLHPGGGGNVDLKWFYERFLGLLQDREAKQDNSISVIVSAIIEKDIFCYMMNDYMNLLLFVCTLCTICSNMEKLSLLTILTAICISMKS